MIVTSRGVWVGLLAVLGFVGSAVAADYGDVVVTLDPLPVGQTVHGYAEFRFTLVNKSKENKHTVRLTMPAEDYLDGGDRLSAITRSVVLEPKAVAKLSLFQPPLAASGEGVRVRIDGKDQRRTLPVSMDHGQDIGYSWGESNEVVLISRSINRSDLETTLARLSGENTLSMGVRLMQQGTSPGNWSTDWFGYTPFDVVLMTDADWQALSGGARVALERAIEAGGALMILGSDWQPPGHWKRWAGRYQNWRAWYPGFGVAVRVSEQNVKEWGNDHWAGLVTLAGDTLKPWRHQRNSQSANTAFKVVESSRIPIRGLFVLMLAFAVLLGPVNFVVLYRMKRRIW
ncbi:MAG: hypothetical protein R3236_04690, partial [Phycisphaeraceae bacterium]|nr:hypothetical protein [Phycisphaeraceae bacterium]